MNRRALLLSLAGHAGLILVVLLIQGAAGRPAPLGGSAVWVEMVTVGEPSSASETHSEENPVQDEDNVPDDAIEPPDDELEEPSDPTQVDDTQEVPVDDHQGTQISPPDDPVAQGTQIEQPAETNPSSSEYIGVDAAGEPGGGAPGPATYEGRVFSAIRRNFRTAAEPVQSYQIEITIGPDGSVDIETIRRSGVDLFDRAVEHALSMAQIPPFPPGRNSPAVLRIEFLGLAED